MTSHWRWRVGADIVCFTYFHNFYIFVVNLYLYLKYSYIYIAICNTWDGKNRCEDIFSR